MAGPERISETLIQWATPAQAIKIRAVIEEGSMRAAARKLGLNFTSIHQTIKSVQHKAALQGYSPQHDLTHPVAPGQKLRGASTLYRRGEAEPVLQWVKSKADDEAREQIVREAVRAWVQDVPPAVVKPAPLDFQDDIIPWIQIGDAHVGMLAQVDEVGASFDLKIAEAELSGAICHLIDELPNSHRMVINDLGDATHYENFAATTEASSHALDFDSRFPKMIRTYSRIMRAVIEKALTKAQHVDVIINQGNHSRTNDIWMAELLHVAYGHTGRVHVLPNDSVFIAYRMGKTLVMVHHSDRCKPRDLIGVLTSDFRKDFGETEFHYIDIGHIHHHMVSKEHPSVIVESFNNLAPNDRWAHDAGYRARKSITMILRSKTYGEVGRRLLPIQEVRDILTRAGKGRAVREKEAFTV